MVRLLLNGEQGLPGSKDELPAAEVETGPAIGALSARIPDSGRSRYARSSPQHSHRGSQQDCL